MKNKRHYKRFSIEDFDIRCRRMSGKELSLLTLTPEGATVKLGEMPEIGSEYMLQLEFETRTVTVKGVVETIELSTADDSRIGDVKLAYITELGFKDLSSDEAAGLAELLMESTGGRRLGGLRVKAVGSPVGAGGSGYYRVQQISFGGMQIETIKKVDVDSKLHLELQFGENQPIRLVGRVASCHEVPGVTPVRFHAGIECLEMRRDALKRLKDFIYSVEGIS